MSEVEKIIVEVDGIEKSMLNVKALKKEFANLTPEAKKNFKELGNSVNNYLTSVKKGAQDTSKELRAVGNNFSKAVDGLGAAGRKMLGGISKAAKGVGSAFQDLSAEDIAEAGRAMAEAATKAEFAEAASDGLGDALLATNNIYAKVAGLALKIFAPAIGRLTESLFGLTDAEKAAAREAEALAQSQQRVKAAVEDTTNAINTELGGAEALFNQLTKSNISNGERSRLISEINTKYGDLLPNLLSEKSTLDQIGKAYTQVKAGILEKTLAEQRAAKLSEAYGRVFNESYKFAENQRLVEAFNQGIRVQGKELEQAFAVWGGSGTKGIELAQSEADQLAASLQETERVFRQITGIGETANEKLAKPIQNAGAAAFDATQITDKYAKKFVDLDKAIEEALDSKRLQTANNLLGERQKLIEQTVKELTKFGKNADIQQFIKDLSEQSKNFTFDFASIRAELTAEFETLSNDITQKAFELAQKTGVVTLDAFIQNIQIQGNKVTDALISTAEKTAQSVNETFAAQLIVIENGVVTLNEAVSNSLIQAGQLTQVELTNLQTFAAQTNAAVISAQKNTQNELAESARAFGELRLAQEKKNIDAQIKVLDNQRRLDLTNVNLSEQERFLIEKKFVDESLKIRQNALEQIKSQGGDVTQEIEENNIQSLENQAKSFDQVAKVIGAGFEKLNEKKEDVFDFNGLVSGLSGIFSNITQSFDIFASFGEEKINRLAESISDLDSQIEESQSRQSELADALLEEEGVRFQATAAALDIQRQREQELAAQKIKLEQVKFAEEQKLAKRRKAIAISEAIAGAAQSIISIFAAPDVLPVPFGFALKAVQAATVAGLTAAQVAKISKQGFADGGFTGDGFDVKDNTGFKVAGVVHENEWVAPKWMTESPKFAPVIQSLENQRVKGFAEGGFTVESTSNALNSSPRLLETFEKYAQAAMKMANRPIVANALDFANVQSSTAKVIQQTTI